MTDRNKDLNKCEEGGKYTNPILAADYSDPDAIRVGEDYYMTASSFSNVPGLPILNSKDLIHWQVVNYALKEIPDEKYNKPIHGCGVWAPAIRYHEGLFYIYFPMPDEGIYVTTAKDPLGDWSKPVNIRPGAGWIDPCPFWDDDGKAYLVAGVAKSRIGYKSVLHMVEMAPDGLSLIGEEKVVFDGNGKGQDTIEGPKLYKRNGWYYIMAPAGGVKEGWQTVLRSRNIYGPYEHKIVMSRGKTDINGPHQGAWVDTVTGEDWFLHFRDVYAAGRITMLEPMRWVDDWPVIGINESNGCGEPVHEYAKPNVGREYASLAPATSDDFRQKKLNLAWQWNANIQDGWYGFTETGLKLNAIFKEGAYADAPNLLLQKWPAPEFSAVTKLDLSNLLEGDEAGVISMGMEYGLVTFRKTSDGISVYTIKGKQFFKDSWVNRTEETETLVGNLKSDTVFVKYVVSITGTRDLNELEKGYPLEEVKLLIASEENAYQEIFSMDSIPGRWVGVKNGLFSLTQRTDSTGYALVEYVKYDTP